MLQTFVVNANVNCQVFTLLCYIVESDIILLA